MARRHRLTLRPMSDVQLTSMMDLSFLLLITFIISFPLIEQGIAVNLPKGRASDLRDDKAWSVTLNREGAIYVNDVALSPEAFATRMAELGRTDPDVRVMIRADEALPYGRVVRVLKVLHDAKISRMALVTQEEGS